mgnify:CR=1 FL=1
MKNVCSVKRPNLIYSSLILLTSFVFLSCGPEKDDPYDREREEDTSASTIVYTAKYLNFEIDIDKITYTGGHG